MRKLFVHLCSFVAYLCKMVASQKLERIKEIWYKSKGTLNFDYIHQIFGSLYDGIRYVFITDYHAVHQRL